MIERTPTVTMIHGRTESLEINITTHYKSVKRMRLRLKMLDNCQEYREGAAQSEVNMNHLLDHWPDGEPRDPGISLIQFQREVEQDLKNLPTTVDEVQQD